MCNAIDSRKLQKKLGCEPSLHFEEGIKETVKWYLDNQEWMNHVTSGEYQKYYEICIVDRPSCPSLDGGSLPYTQALNPYHRD